MAEQIDLKYQIGVYENVIEAQSKIIADIQQKFNKSREKLEIYTEQINNLTQQNQKLEEEIKEKVQTIKDLGQVIEFTEVQLRDTRIQNADYQNQLNEMKNILITYQKRSSISNSIETLSVDSQVSSKQSPTFQNNTSFFNHIKNNNNLNGNNIEEQNQNKEYIQFKKLDIDQARISKDEYTKAIQENKEIYRQTQQLQNLEHENFLDYKRQEDKKEQEKQEKQQNLNQENQIRQSDQLQNKNQLQQIQEGIQIQQQNGSDVSPQQEIEFEQQKTEVLLKNGVQIKQNGAELEYQKTVNQKDKNKQKKYKSCLKNVQCLNCDNFIDLSQYLVLNKSELKKQELQKKKLLEYINQELYKDYELEQIEQIYDKNKDTIMTLIKCSPLLTQQQNQQQIQHEQQQNTDKQQQNENQNLNKNSSIFSNSNISQHPENYKIWEKEIVPLLITPNNLVTIYLNKEEKQEKVIAKIKPLVKKFIPAQLRQVIWPLLIGNKLRINKSLFHNLVELKENNPIPQRTQNLIVEDLNRTYPNIREFDKGTKLYQDLQYVLELWHFYRPDIGYIQGMAYPCAIMHLNFQNIYKTFKNFVNLILGKPFVTNLYKFKVEYVNINSRVFDQLLQERHPKIYKHLQNLKIQSEVFLIEWFYTLFCRAFTLPVVVKCWDLFLYYDEVALFKISLGIFTLIEEEILQSDFDDTLFLIRNCTSKINQNNLLKVVVDYKMKRDKFDEKYRKEKYKTLGNSQKEQQINNLIVNDIQVN